MDKNEIAALYRDLPYLEAYRRHTDLRVAADPHQAVGARWDELGALQFNYLVDNGLEPDDRMFDIGCGTLRGGRHFIRYLTPKRYTGVDISSAAIESAKGLVAAEGLTEKHPTLLWNPEPEVWFGNLGGATFDVLLAQSVFTHLDVPYIAACFPRLCTVMAPGARFFFTFNEAETSRQRNIKGFGHPFRLFSELAASNGFRVEKRSDYAHPLKQIMAVLTWASS
jgi:SAM-dependent methyltransferase